MNGGPEGVCTPRTPMHRERRGRRQLRERPAATTSVIISHILYITVVCEVKAHIPINRDATGSLSRTGGVELVQDSVAPAKANSETQSRRRQTETAAKNIPSSTKNSLGDVRSVCRRQSRGRTLARAEGSWVRGGDGGSELSLPSTYRERVSYEASFGE